MRERAVRMMQEQREEYPITRIKIDRAFVQGMLVSRREASVVRALLDMAHSFELQAIAEGIETEAQL